VSAIDTAFRNEERFQTRFVELLDELKPVWDQLRAALYTRNRTLPGDVFLIACDDNYYRHQIVDLRENRFAGQVAMLRSDVRRGGA
jgi:hypothetical protein